MEKLPPTSAKSIFENTMGNPFLLLFSILTKMLQNLLVEYKIYITLWENCFWKWFWTSGSALTIKCIKVKVQGHLSRSEIIFKSSFLIKCFIITIIICFKAFQSELEKVKNGFPIVFPKMDLADVGGNYHIWALKLGRTVYINTLKSPKGA